MTKDEPDKFRDRRNEEEGEPMTRDEAQRRAAALTAAGSDHHWLARKGTDGGSS